MPSTCPVPNLQFVARSNLFLSLPNLLRRTHSERLLPDEQPCAPDVAGGQLCSRCGLDRSVSTPCTAWGPPCSSLRAFMMCVLHARPLSATLVVPTPGCDPTSTHARSRACVPYPPACAGYVHALRCSNLFHAHVVPWYRERACVPHLSHTLRGSARTQGPNPWERARGPMCARALRLKLAEPSVGMSGPWMGYIGCAGDPLSGPILA